MEKDCIFCKIIKKEAESEILYEDELIIAIRDIRPKAPHHILMIIKEHIESLNDFTEDKAEVLGKLLVRAAEIAKKEGFAESGYKVITNIGNDGGQIIHHFHFHIVGGEPIKVVV